MFWLRLYLPDPEDDGGLGKTPRCPEAQYKVGQRFGAKMFMRYRWDGMIAAVVPPGVWPEHALHDAAGIPRRKVPSWAPPGRVVKYVCAFWQDSHPYLLRERQLSAFEPKRAKVHFAVTEEDYRRFDAITPAIHHHRRW